MTYRNDPYDPKQVALLDQSSLDEAVAQAQKAFAEASDVDALVAIRHQHLGDRAPVVAGPPRDRRAAAQREGRRRQARQRGPRVDPVGLRRPAGRARGRPRPPGAGRGGRRRHAADRPASPRRPPSADHADGAHRRPVHRHGVRDRRGSRGRAGVDELRRPQHGARPPGPDHDGHVLRRQRARSRGASRRTGWWSCAPTPRRCRPARCSPARRRSTSSAPGRVYRTDELDATHTPVFHQVEGLVVDAGHHDGPPQGDAGPLRPGHVRARGEDPAAPVVLPVHRAVGRAGPVVPAGPRRRPLDRVGWLRHGQPAGAAWRAAWTRRSTPASRSAWASSAR